MYSMGRNVACIVVKNHAGRATPRLTHWRREKGPMSFGEYLFMSGVILIDIISLNGSETHDFSRGRRTVPPFGGPPFYFLSLRDVPADGTLCRPGFRET